MHEPFIPLTGLLRGFCERVLIGLILFSNASWINNKHNELEKAPSLVTVYVLDPGTVFTSVEFLKESPGFSSSSGNRSEPFVKSDIEANGVLRGILLIIWKNQILPPVSETLRAQ